MVADHEIGLPTLRTVERSFKFLGPVVRYRVPVGPFLFHPLLNPGLRQPQTLVVVKNACLHFYHTVIADIITQSFAKNELDEKQDNLQCLGDDHLIISLIVVIAMMLDSVPNSLNFLNRGDLFFRQS